MKVEYLLGCLESDSLKELRDLITQELLVRGDLNSGDVFEEYNRKTDGSLEELLAVLDKYWPNAIADITEDGKHGEHDSITINFDFMDNARDAQKIHTGEATFWRPDTEKIPTFVVNLYTKEDINDPEIFEEKESCIFINASEPLEY